MQRLPLVIALLLVSVVAASAQTTYTDSVAPNVRRNYSFTSSGPGQLIATLSWDHPPADLLMILVCGVPGSTSDPLTYGVAAGQLDRTARLEAGLLGRLNCVLGISTFDEGASFRVNIQLTTGQTASPLSLLAPQQRDAMTETRLLEHADKVFRTLQAR